MESGPIRISIAVVEHEGKYLVGRRDADAVLPGLAEFPGGKCLPDESTERCAERECKEETGLNVVAGKLLERVVHRYEHATVDLSFWLCAADPADVRAEHGAFRWYSQAELLELEFPEANRSVLAALATRDESAQ